MDEKKVCAHCGRLVDATARACPFCAHEQFRAVGEAAPAAPVVTPAASPAPVAPAPAASRPAGSAMTKGLVIAAVAVVAVALFLVGMLARRFGSSPPRQRVQAGSPAAAPKTPPPPNPIADLQFVVSTDSNGQTVTTTMAPNMTDTAPAGTGATSTAGGDATAMPAEQYGRISQAPPAAPTTTSPMKPVDPRTIPGDVVAPPRPAPVPKPRTEKPAEERTARAERTSPVPISQPLPNIDHERLREDVSLRFDLTVGADGRVKEIQVLRSGGGLTGAMIESIQKWRFKPGTLDGEPVESHFTVDVSFQAR